MNNIKIIAYDNKVAGLATVYNTIEMVRVVKLSANTLTNSLRFGIISKRVSAKLNITRYIGRLFRHLEMYSSG